MLTAFKIYMNASWMSVVLKQPWELSIFCVLSKKPSLQYLGDQNRPFRAFSEKIGLVPTLSKKSGTCILKQKSELNYSKKFAKMKIYKHNFLAIDHKYRNLREASWASRNSLATTLKLKMSFEKREQKILNSILKFSSIWIRSRLSKSKSIDSIAENKRHKSSTIW